MRVLWKTILAFLFGFMAYVIGTAYIKLDLGKSVTPYGDCTRLGLPAAPEAFVEIDGLVIASTTDWAKISFTNRRDIMGGLVVIDPKKPAYETINLESFPENVEFRPHGIALWTDGTRRLLYVVNHAMKNGGERIEVFSIPPEFTTESPAVKWERFVGFPDLPTMGLNGLTVVSEYDLYAV
jgi:hypothetical protein